MPPNDSPYFFMREFSHEELSNLLINKVKELKAEKLQSQELNEELQENLAQLEETTAKLEEAEEALRKERDNLKLEVKQKTNELLKKEKLSVIGELSARIAHDLRNPLSIIKNSAELIKIGQKNMDSKTKSHWERLDRGIYRISHQVDDVLDYVRDSPIKKKPTKISAVLRGVYERIIIPDKIKINLPKTDVTIPCDHDKLETVFVNLIMNSIQAMGDKIGIININLIEESDDVILITVKDTGPGIPHSLIPKIFEPLFTTRQIGTGLGLPSCKNIIEKHGGSIDVSSARGKGATFLIRLPTKTEWENLSKIGDKEKLTDYITSESV
ncbi:MAG: sensor histidine kinase [Nitrosopumilaceae archaeon]